MTKKSSIKDTNLIIPTATTTTDGELSANDTNDSRHEKELLPSTYTEQDIVGMALDSSNEEDLPDTSIDSPISDTIVKPKQTKGIRKSRTTKFVSTPKLVTSVDDSSVTEVADKPHPQKTADEQNAAKTVNDQNAAKTADKPKAVKSEKLDTNKKRLSSQDVSVHEYSPDEEKAAVPQFTVNLKSQSIPRVKRSVTELLNLSSVVKCPFPPHTFEKPLQCTHVMLIYECVPFNRDALSECTSQALQLLSLRTVIKSYTSTFVVNSSGNGVITILISLKNRSTVSKPENFVFSGITPTIHSCPKVNYALRFLIVNFNKIHPYTDEYFLTDNPSLDLIE
jgi:hypothetical protein